MGDDVRKSVTNEVDRVAQQARSKPAVACDRHRRPHASYPCQATPGQQTYMPDLRDVILQCNTI